MNYYVIAKVYIREKRRECLRIVGAFNLYYLADMFQTAYNKKFSANAKIVERSGLMDLIHIDEFDQKGDYIE